MNYNGTQMWGETDDEAEKRERGVFDPRVYDPKSHETGDEPKPAADKPEERAKREEEGLEPVTHSVSQGVGQGVK